jgi:hypothetical protein
MEAILGLATGYFISGVSVWKFKQLPTPDQFELRGYTQCPDGETFEGIVLRENGAPRPKYFARDGKPANQTAFGRSFGNAPMYPELRRRSIPLSLITVV